MSDQGELYENSWILYHILDRFIGSQDTVAVRRRLTVVEDELLMPTGDVYDMFSTGSRAEGMELSWSDSDNMVIIKHTAVICPDQDISNQHDTGNKTVLMMRKARSRPGYVNLELLHRGPISDPFVERSIVAVGDAYFLSSEIGKLASVHFAANILQINAESHGPANNMTIQLGSYSGEIDQVYSFPCYNWPSEANEWVSRPRLYDWPDKTLRDEIVQGGCHLVPVGDKTSAADQSLQWMISFTTAERKLIHSLTHVQFLIYGLLKYLLKQISGMLDQILDETDILSSYIIKTCILYAVENTSKSLWQEKHMFLCFMFCFKILINWVKTGYCPNYFIKTTNMFLGKVHGKNQQNLLRYLTELYYMNWKCLSVGRFIQPTIGERIDSVRSGAWEYVLPPPSRLERERDIELFINTDNMSHSTSDNLPVLLELLSASQSDTDEFVAFYGTCSSLSLTGMEMFCKHRTAKGNKEKYKSLRKTKNLLIPLSAVSESPGLLTLATYHYNTGNYMKTLEICDSMILSPKCYIHGLTNCTDGDRYEQLYCGRGYTLLQKRQAVVSDVAFNLTTLQFCPSQLQQVIVSKRWIETVPPPQLLPPTLQQQYKAFRASNLLLVPPKPYAVFLSFLCYHELGDTRMRDTALINLQTVKHGQEQVGCYYWIVHNLLGICYEMIGDKRRALREYRESLGVKSFTQYLNPARELIERLQHLQ